MLIYLFSRDDFVDFNIDRWNCSVKLFALPGNLLRAMSIKNRKTYLEIYRGLEAFYGPQLWWPVIPDDGSAPEYRGGPVNHRQRLEVMVGAVLAQNTAWNQARKALENLHRAGLLGFDQLCQTGEQELAALILPSGYYNQKARRLKRLVSFLRERYGSSWERIFTEPTGRMRAMLLGLNGIGPETADSILLYAAGRCSFVIDSYTRRLWHRLDLAPEHAPYEELKMLFEEALPKKAALYGEYHALVVAHCVNCCKSRSPGCGLCPLAHLCGRKGLDGSMLHKNINRK